jgi:adenine phosphoribosyltransferase
MKTKIRSSKPKAQDRADSKIINQIQDAIRDIPDFPKEGIVFKDITPLLADGKLFEQAVIKMTAPYLSHRIDKIVAIESRGFIFGAALANNLGAGFVPVRKAGKLPSETNSESYSLEYGTDQLEMHADAILRGEKVLVVDDVLATGGTASATCRLVEQLSGKVIGLSFLIELTLLGGRSQLENRPINAVIQY